MSSTIDPNTPLPPLGSGSRGRDTYVAPSTDKVNELLVQNGHAPTRQNRRRFLRQAQKEYERAMREGRA